MDPDGAILTSILILPTVILAYLYYRMANKRFLMLASKIPGPPGYPIIGNALELRGSAHQIFDRLMGLSVTYRDVSRLWAGPRLFIFITHPADIELVLSSSEHLDKSDEYNFLRPWLGNGLLVSSGEKWRHDRRMIAPTFHLNVLKRFMSRFNENARLAVRRLGEAGAEELDVHDYMSETTVETLLETVMGVNKEEEGRQYYKYAMAVMKICDIIHLRQLKFYLRPDFLFSGTSYGKEQRSLLGVIHGLTKKVLRRKQDEMRTRDQAGRDQEDPAARGAGGEGGNGARDDGGFSYGQASALRDDIDLDDIDGKKRRPFLEELIGKSAEGELTEAEVKEQLDTIMFEGHDTTASASSFFLCIMAAYPEIQEKCLEEIDRVLGGRRKDDDVTLEDTIELKYLERCLMETMRLYPPVPAIARRLTSEVKLASRPVVIPANCTVVISMVKLHRRADIYTSPDEFNPDNFLSEKSSQRHYYSYIPFSAGPRSCVGRKYAMLKLKTLLATILRNYRVLPGIPEAEWKLQADIILKRADGFRVRLEPRTPQ